MPGCHRTAFACFFGSIVLGGCAATPVPPADLLGLATACVERNGFTDPAPVPPIITGRETAEEALTIASLSNGLTDDERAIVEACMRDAGA